MKWGILVFFSTTMKDKPCFCLSGLGIFDKIEQGHRGRCAMRERMTGPQAGASSTLFLPEGL
jgi:hypothetical protein